MHTRQPRQARLIREGISIVARSTKHRKEVIKIGWWGYLWDLAYIWKTPWDIHGPRPELVRLVENGELKPGRAIDLGCGAGDNAIYLAQQGFEVSGFDISS